MDLSQLSDEQLNQLAQAKSVNTASASVDLSSLSDEQLQHLAESKGIRQASAAGEIARPFLKAAKSVATSTVGGLGDLAQEAINLPYFAGFKGAQKLDELVTGKKSDAKFKPLFGGINSASPMIREAFDKVSGGLTKSRNKTEEILEIPEEIVGGVVGPGAISKGVQAVKSISNLPKNILQKAARVNPEKVRAFEESGINPRLADVTDGQTTKTFQNVLGNFPGSRGVIEKATQDQIDNIANQITGITKNEGGTVQQAGKTIQEGAKNLQTLAAKRADKLYNDLDKFIPKDRAGNNVAIPTSRFSEAINSPEVQDVAAVKGGTIQGLIKRYEKLADTNGNIPYDRVKIFRGTIGKESYSHSLSESEKSAAKQLYGALSGDMKSAVVTGGGKQGLQAFNKANNAFYRHLDILDSKINPLVEAKTPEAVYSMALNGSKQGGSNIKVIMKSLDPLQKDFVRGTVTKRMGLANAGEQDSTGEVFSPNKFLTEWNKLSPEARSNIFTKEQTGAITNLNKAISTIKESAKARQSSNNLPYAAWAGLGGLTVAKPVAGVGALAGARITAKMMTDPKFINWLAQTPKVAPKMIPSHIKLLSGIAAANPAIREDVLDYIGSATVGDANADDLDLTNDEIQSSLENQKQQYPGLNAGIEPSSRAKEIEKRYY